MSSLCTFIRIRKRVRQKATRYSLLVANAAHGAVLKTEWPC